MRLPVLLALVTLVMVLVLQRRAARARRKLPREELDDLRRIYRHDNPRGPGLEPLIQDQQRMGIEPRPVDPEET